MTHLLKQHFRRGVNWTPVTIGPCQSSDTPSLCFNPKLRAQLDTLIIIATKAAVYKLLLHE